MFIRVRGCFEWSFERVISWTDWWILCGFAGTGLVRGFEGILIGREGRTVEVKNRESGVVESRSE